MDSDHLWSAHARRRGLGQTLADRALSMLVIDASVAVAASLAKDGWELLQGEDLISPPLVLSEASSALHEARWRGEIAEDDARIAMERLAAAPLQIQRVPTLMDAWKVADMLGWAKTYDAEYVALARGLGCRLVTLDQRLRRGAQHVVEIIGPADL